MTHARWAPRLRRFLAGIAGLALLGGAALVPSAQSTDAAWTDAEVGAATFTATTLEAPVATQACEANGGLLGLVPELTIHWRVPASMDGYSVADGNVEFVKVDANGLLISVTDPLFGTIEHDGDVTSYTTDAGFGLLGTIPVPGLGSTGTMALRFTGPGGWTSDWLVAEGVFPTLFAPGQCATSTVSEL